MVGFIKGSISPKCARWVCGEMSQSVLHGEVWQYGIGRTEVDFLTTGLVSKQNLLIFLLRAVASLYCLEKPNAQYGFLSLHSMEPNILIVSLVLCQWTQYLISVCSVRASLASGCRSRKASGRS